MGAASSDELVVSHTRGTSAVELPDVLLGMLDRCGCGVGAAMERVFRFCTTEGCIVACERGDIEVVRGLLALEGRAAVNVHCEDQHGPEACLRLACVNGHVDVLRELLALTGDREMDVHADFRGVPEACFRAACENGHVGVVRVLLALTGHREVDVHARGEDEPGDGFQIACTKGHAGVLRELLGLTGHRAIPLQARLAAGEVAELLTKDAVWAGTSTRHGRKAMLLLRSGTRRQLGPATRPGEWQWQWW